MPFPKYLVHPPSVEVEADADHESEQNVQCKADETIDKGERGGMPGTRLQTGYPDEVSDTGYKGSEKHDSGYGHYDPDRCRRGSVYDETSPEQQTIR